MTTQCPVCNGLGELNASCERCGTSLTDQGRLEQLYGPYSPYREIDHMKLTNGFPDVAYHQCIHVADCPNCNNQQLIFVQEI